MITRFRFHPSIVEVAILVVGIAVAFGPMGKAHAAAAPQGETITEATLTLGSVSMGTNTQGDEVTVSMPPGHGGTINTVPATWPEIWQGIRYMGQGAVIETISETAQGTAVTGVDPSLVTTWKQQASAAGLSPYTVDQFLNMIAQGDQLAVKQYGWTGTVAPQVPVQQPVATPVPETPSNPAIAAIQNEPQQAPQPAPETMTPQDYASQPTTVPESIGTSASKATTKVEIPSTGYGVQQDTPATQPQNRVVQATPQPQTMADLTPPDMRKVNQAVAKANAERKAARNHRSGDKTLVVLAIVLIALGFAGMFLAPRVMAMIQREKRRRDDERVLSK